MNFIFSLPKCFILLSLVPYAIFHIVNCKKKDERDEFIAMKTFKIVQKLTLVGLFILSSINFFYKSLNANFLLSSIIGLGLYSEIIFTIYFQKKY